MRSKSQFCVLFVSVCHILLMVTQCDIKYEKSPYFTDRSHHLFWKPKIVSFYGICVLFYVLYSSPCWELVRGLPALNALKAF